MTSREDFNKLRDLFYIDWMDEDFDDVGVWNNLEKDLQILEILKSSIILIENKQITLGYGKYHLAIRPDVILSDDTIQLIRKWLNDK